MKVSPTELMKKLKTIEEEIMEIHESDEKKSFVLASIVPTKDGEETLKPLYSSNYDFLGNRERINELYKEERSIKKLLNYHNNNTIIAGYDFTIYDGLILISELKNEINVLSRLTKKNTYEEWRDKYYIACYDTSAVKKVLREYQDKVSTLQVAIDRMNLETKLDY